MFLTLNRDKILKEEVSANFLMNDNEYKNNNNKKKIKKIIKKIIIKKNKIKK